MRIKVLYTIAVLGAALAIRSKIVWESCGSDCGIFIADGPLAAIGGWYFGLAVIFISVLLIILKATKSDPK